MTIASDTLSTPRVRVVTAGSVFAVAWAGANIVHILTQTRGDLDPVSWVNLGVALWVFGRPSSAHRLAALAAVEVFNTLWMLPLPPDHQLLASVVNLGVLIAYVSLARPSSVDAMLRAFAPTARVCVLMAYAAAATAKYNTDFLSTATSCADFMAKTASFGMLQRSSPLAGVPIVFTIASETLIPILLLVPRTRRWGVVFAATFHYVLSLSPAIGVGDFTVTLWALYLLFLPTRDVETLGRRALATWRRIPPVRATDSVPRWVFAAVFAAVVAAGSVGTGIVVVVLVWLLTTVVGGWLIISLILVLRADPHDVRPLGRPSGFQLVPIVVMLALVSSPYLGFGTSSRFTMFSGLRTEGAGSNHLFMPSTHLIDSQNSSLVVVDANDVSPVLGNAARHKAAIPLAQLREILQDPDVRATFETSEGSTISVEPGDASSLRAAPSWWEAKTQHYRAFKVKGVTDPGFCSN
jgi:hypothetical protein